MELLSRHPLRRVADFRKLFLGDVLSTVAERYFVLTVSWWLLAEPGGGKRLGLLLALFSVPVLAIGLLIGPLVDRSDKRAILVASSALQGVVVAAVALAFAAGALTFPLLCASAVLLGCLLPVFEGAVHAALPRTVRSADLLAATAVQSSTLEFSNIGAAALSSTVIALYGVQAALAVNAALHLLATGFLWRLRLRPLKGAEALAARESNADLRQGLSFLRSDRPLLVFVAIHLATILLTVPLLVIIPMIVREVLHGAVVWLGVLEVGFSLGAIGTALALSLRSRHRAIYSSYALMLTLLAGQMLALHHTRNPYWMLAIVVVMGSGVASLFALAAMVFQNVVLDRLKGRFFGTLETLAAVVTPLGYTAVGLFSSGAGVGNLLYANAAGLALLAAIVLIVPRTRQDLEPRVSALSMPQVQERIDAR